MLAKNYTLKICAVCGAEKPLSDFSRKQSSCKSCRNARALLERSKAKPLTQKRLHDLFKYDCETGSFTRIAKAGQRRVGSIAGNLSKTTGYLYIRVDHVLYGAHRLAFLYVHGYLPKQTDHINHNRSDNRIANLRDVDNSENHKNRPMQKNNTSGIVGVSWCKQHGKWQAKVKVNGKTIHLGRYSDLSAAAEVVSKARKDYGFHHNHGKQSATPSAQRRSRCA